MKNSKFDKLFNTIMEEAKPSKKHIIKEDASKEDREWLENKLWQLDFDETDNVITYIADCIGDFSQFKMKKDYRIKQVVEKYIRQFKLNDDYVEDWDQPKLVEQIQDEIYNCFDDTNVEINCRDLASEIVKELNDEGIYNKSDARSYISDRCGKIIDNSSEVSEDDWG